MTQPSFRVDPARLAPIADSMDRLGNALTGVSRCLRRYASGDDAVFAEYGAAKAWSDLLKVWTDEVKIASWAAHEWSGSVREAIDNYVGGDADAAERLGPR
ncbi:hypothetical protein HC031_04920 [Planosporangium thailandense]|uniref:WXG100 family type VII secretion target n=1 Tax=Planosporangium thailandense TaxID=765197 RepID=A0ABX0XV34_9ACTN|nr:hypothetical protein [Planosporangium thailandense]NJC69068.1 hypothetical protein [Planosporangium thailandense]